MAKKELIIYEGAMCCATGICGPEPDMKLIEFNETLAKLQNEFSELKVIRAGMTSKISMFLENKEIFSVLKENGPAILPIITLCGKIISKQKYLPYAEFRALISSTNLL